MSYDYAMFSTIISAHELNRIVSQQSDSSSSFSSSCIILEIGSRAWSDTLPYCQGHIPGALYVDMNQDLTAQPGHPCLSQGRHPLPTREDFAHTLAQWGITPQTQVIVYDRQGLSLCVRAWWMLQYMGHEAVAVLDGGYYAWEKSSYKIDTELPEPQPVSTYSLSQPRVQLWTIEDVKKNIQQHTHILLDARCHERYLGNDEPLDKKAGHIPGARNRPMTELLTDEGFFHSPHDLATNIKQATKGYGSAHSVVYCGSGITATPGVLAAKIAGLEEPAMFAGSFSEWSSDPHNPIETGEASEKSSHKQHK